MIGNLTRICSTCPDQLGKTFTLTPDGTLCKTTAGQMVQGTYTTETFSTVADLAAILKDTTTSEALSASLPTSGQVKGRVVTEKALAANPGAVARTKRHFGLPSGQAGFMCLDADVPKDGQPLTREQLWALTLSLCPDAASTGVVYWPSGSSFIHEGSHQHKGIGGQHLYLLVSDISDTERAGRTLTKRLWLAGHGRVDVSASGALLLRSVFDDAVHQPARLLFVGGAVCTPPLEQRRGLPLILSEGGFLDTKHAIPDLTPDEEGRYLALVESAKARAEPQARAAQQAWRDARKKAHLSQAVAQGQDLQQAKEQIERTLDAALGGSLLGTFPLVLVNDEGREQTVSVDSVLKERARFHLARCLDPLNNDHRARTPDAILYLQQAQPVIYSLDEGGVIYRLLRQPARLAVTSGDKARLAEQIADELRHEQDLFALSGQVVRVAGGQFAAMSRPMLHYRIGCRVSLYRQGKDKQVATEPDAPLLDIVLALLPERLRSITGRSSIPLIDTVGRVISTPGFDTPTGLYLDLKPDDVPTIPKHPTRQQTVEALRRLWAPWQAYQWATPHCRAAMLATALTMPLRPTIESAPGLFADAAMQGSGKSKSIGSIAAIVRGHRGGMKTWGIDQEQELSKYLLSAARTGDPCIAIDNVVGTFKSQSIATAMVEGRLNERMLGVSEVLTPAFRVQWLASGNQATVDRDMATRWLVARINTGAEHPSLLSYPFDPVDRALSDRMGIAAAAVVVHRAWHAAGCPRADSVNTRFAEWGSTIRQCCFWLQTSGIAAESGIGNLGDPAHSILTGSIANDPESESLALTLFALSEIYSGKAFTATEAKREFDLGEFGGDEARRSLHEGISGLIPSRNGKLSPQALNWIFKNRRDRPAGGLKLELLTQSGANRGAVWRVVPVQARQPS